MNLSFQINCHNFHEFVDHWSSVYIYDDEEKYDSNIGKPLTEESLMALFEWKNGRLLSKKKLASIQENYPLRFTDDCQQRYLNHKQPGGAIWNIFYLHCLDPASWPIFDQHVFRAMKYIQTGSIVEIGNTNKEKKYSAYQIEYMPFIAGLTEFPQRTLDKALFSFGQFLKKAEPYTWHAHALPDAELAALAPQAHQWLNPDGVLLLSASTGRPGLTRNRDNAGRLFIERPPDMLQSCVEDAGFRLL
jgi:hypothetical protein